MHPRQWKTTSKVGMRRRHCQFGAILSLLVCVCGHVSEIFDRWDNTAQSGADIDYGMVLVALIAGAVLGLAHVSIRAFRRASGSFGHFLFATFSPSSTRQVFSGSHSPLPPLRI